MSNISLVPHTGTSALTLRPPFPPSVFARPSSALPQEPVRLQCVLPQDSPDCDVCLAVGEGAFERLPVDNLELVRSFPTPGATVALFAQARNAGGESAIAVGGVSILSYCAVTTELTEARSVCPLEGCAAFAIGCDDGGVLLCDESPSRFTVLRTGSPGAAAPLVGSDGRVVTSRMVITPEPDGRSEFQTEILVHGIYTGELEGQFRLLPKEGIAQLIAGGHAATRREVRSDYRKKYWSGIPIPPDETPHETRILDLRRRTILGAYPGTLMATARSGYGAVAYFFDDTLHFVSDFRHGKVRSTYYLQTVRGGTGHKVLFCPSGEFALVTAHEPITQGAFTTERVSWQVVRTSTARWKADLPEKFTPVRFVTEALLWAVDRTASSARLVLYDWTSRRTVDEIPFFEIEERLRPAAVETQPKDVPELLNQSTREAQFAEFLNSMQIGMFSDPIMPDVLAGLRSSPEGRQLEFLRKTEGYRIMHRVTLPLRPRNDSPLAATQRRVYQSRSTVGLGRYDLVTGAPLKAIALNAAQAEAGVPQPSSVVGSYGPMVVYTDSSKNTVFWFFDERTEVFRRWEAPAGTVEVAWLSGDLEGRHLLFDLALGDPVAEKTWQMENLRRGMGMMNRAFATDEAGRATPPDEQKPLERPPRLPGVATVDAATGETHLVGVPDPIKSTCWDPERHVFLVQTAQEHDLFNEDHTRLTKQTVALNVYAITPDGGKEHILAQDVESFVDQEHVTGVGWSSDGRQWTSGTIHKPLFALSRAQPGRLAFYNLFHLGMVDAYTGVLLWTAENPLRYRCGVPWQIVPFPDGRIWATFGSGDSVLIDAEGHAEAMDVATNYRRPIVTPNAILFDKSGIWQPIVK